MDKDNNINKKDSKPQAPSAAVAGKKESGVKKPVKPLTVIIDVIIALFLIFSVTMAVMSIISSKQRVPSLFGKGLFTVQSNSMEPTFKKGDLLICNVNFDPAELKVGDVITFRDQNLQGIEFYNTHRITRIETEDNFYNIYTKGDNTPAEDQYDEDGNRKKAPLSIPMTGTSDKPSVVARWNKPGNEKGTVIKGMGTVLDFLQSQTGILICFVIPLALFFIYALYKFILSLVRFKEKDKTKDEKEAIEKAAIEKYIREHGGIIPDSNGTNNDQSAVPEAKDETTE